MVRCQPGHWSETAAAAQRRARRPDLTLRTRLALPFIFGTPPE